MDGAEKVWFREARHVEEISGTTLNVESKDHWQKIRDRMKTVSVALVLCLNVGVDPPDIVKPKSCARKLAWVDPSTSNPQKAAQRIAASLQLNYEKLQPRARYKSAIDPTVDCVRKLCSGMRRNAKDDRVLFHFNGYGVPKPTDAGEIWVFNKNITQYIPLSLYDLQAWMGAPSVYVWDCSSAGKIVNMFVRFAEDHCSRWMEDCRAGNPTNSNEGVTPSSTPDANEQLMVGSEPRSVQPPRPPPPSSRQIQMLKECIQLAACSANEELPCSNPELPADLFTCCLVSPIQTSLLNHMLKTGTKSHFPPNCTDEIPGVATDRRTLLGELNWIFTAITDTIAWSSLPLDTFQRLFRQDMLVAALFRSFFLAERVMRENGCQVVSQPQLPSVYSHPLWQYWDYTLDVCIANLHTLVSQKGGLLHMGRNDYFVSTSLKHNLLVELPPTIFSGGGGGEMLDYSHSSFFLEQLQAFECWLKFGVDKSHPPQQLPVLLQVLLSQVHRVRAVELLARFVDLGNWAVVAALSVGIFLYVQKLLQCNTRELRPSLAFIWAKILPIDSYYQYELVKDHDYFINILRDPDVSPRFKIVPAFVIATLIHNNYKPAQERLVQSDYVNLCIELLSHEQVLKCRMLCLWLLIGLGRLWSDHDAARWLAVRNVAYERVEDFLEDDVPEVRAAAVYALGGFVHNRNDTEHATVIENEVCDILCEKVANDGSVLVRAELVSAIQWFLLYFEDRFSELCIGLDRQVEATRLRLLETSNGGGENGKRTLPLVEEYPENNTAGRMHRSSSTACSSAGAAKHHLSSRPVGRRRSGAVADQMAIERELASAIEEAATSASANGSPFKLQVLGQMRSLEARNFKGPFERIWLSLLRLCFDPYVDVSSMSEKLVGHIFTLSSRVKISRLSLAEQLDTRASNLHIYPESDESKGSSPSSTGPDKHSLHATSTSNNNYVTFMIGSPGVLQTTPPAPAIAIVQPPQGKQQQRARKLSSLENPSTFGGGGIRASASLAVIETSSANFTPKRNLYGNQSGSYIVRNRPNSDTDSCVGEGVVSTNFVDWCSKIFSGQIYNTIYGDPESTSATTTSNITTANNNRHLLSSLVDSDTPFTVANPTDWILHTHEGLKQAAHRDVELLRSEDARCEAQCLNLKLDRTATSIVWSFLRPYVYTCDGASVSLFHTQSAQRVLSFRAYNEPLVVDSICDLMVANELTHELLLTGTVNGLLKVWDPMFSEHSHDLQSGEPKLITAAYLLNDVPRITRAHKSPNETLYRWDQCCGRVVCGGNVRLCRVWDAWAEKSVLDLNVTSKNIPTTAIASELSSNLVSCGFADGAFAVYDVRLPSSECEIMRLRHFTSPIVGCALTSSMLIVGSSDGDVRIWEPRMYQEPIVDFNVSVRRDYSNKGVDTPLLVMHAMDVQTSGQLIGCAMADSTLCLFDVSGKKCLSQIRYGPTRDKYSPRSALFSSLTGGGGGEPSPSAANIREMSRPTAMRFHQSKLLVGVSTRDNSVTAYSLPGA